MPVKYKTVKITIAQRIRNLKAELKYYIERVNELDDIQNEILFSTTSFYELQLKREEFESAIYSLQSRIKTLEKYSGNKNEVLLNLKYKIVTEEIVEIDYLKNYINFVKI